VWKRRNRGIVVLLWAHVAGIFVFGLLRGFGPLHMVLESGVIAVLTLVAGNGRLSRNRQMCAATLAMFSSSAELVHLSGGLIEMHFHFFVMVAVVTLYQSWLPFLLAIAYVVLHHGFMGALDPASVYNHPSALLHPWRWAAVHGLFILGESVACLTAWRLNETESMRGDKFHRQLATLVQASDDAIVGLTPGGRVTSWNPGAERLFGYDAPEMLGRSVRVLLDPSSSDPPGLLDSLDEHGAPGPDGADEPGASPGSPEAFEAFVSSCAGGRQMRGIRKDGAVLDLSVTLSPITSPGGALTGLSAIARDVSDVKRAEAARESSLSLLQATLESTADGILVVDRSGRLVSFNSMFVNLWRIPGSVLAAHEDGMTIEHMLDQLVRPDRFLEKIRELAHQPASKSYDMLEFKDGRVYERYSLPQEVGGECVGRVWSFRDVTERERTQRKLQEAFEREQEAAQSLRAVDEMKNTFLQAVSHELRTPLTSVLGYALTLEHHHESFSMEAKDEMLRAIVRSAHKLDRLLSDLLDVDRMSRGVLEPRVQPTDMVPLVETTLEEVNTDQHQVDVHTDPVVAEVDAPKVQRILENLIANAVKYTPEGTRISVRVEAAPGGLHICVEDEGPGIADDLKTSIFEPFRRGEIQSFHSPGTGIGLALVARFAELHHGRAWVEDRGGGGATFHVELACSVVPAAGALPLPQVVDLDH
jgi:signal transduction histidine kinase